MVEAVWCRENFTGIEDYPYATAVVDTVEAWRLRERRYRKPALIVLISRPTGARLFIDVVRTESQWRRVWNGQTETLECPVELLDDRPDVMRQLWEDDSARERH
jgi:hypothetical protein